MTEASAPTSTLRRVVSGPIVAPVSTTVAPSSWVPGSRVTSEARVTAESIHVVSGSMIVTPSRIQCWVRRRLSSRPRRASWVRSLTPSVCQTSSSTWAPTGNPSATARPTMSVRYSSPWTLSVSRLATASARNSASTARMPLFTSRIMRSVSSASPSSRMAVTAEVSSRTMRPYPARVVELGRQDRDHVAGRAVVVEQLTDRLGGQERHVAIRDQHGALGSRAQRLERHLDGVAGSALVLLHGQHDLWIDLGDRRRHLVAVVPDDGHGASDAGLADGDQRVRDHAAPGQLVEHLGALRSHPRARARGEDDGGDLFAHSSPCARGLAPAVAAQSIVERGESNEGRAPRFPPHGRAPVTMSDRGDRQDN